MSKVYSFRLSEDVASKLEANAKLLKLSTSAYIALKIEQDYDSLRGNPKLNEAIELLDDMAELFKRFEESLK